jgi:hypothetical protein
MKNEVQKPHNGNQPGRGGTEDDPKTWYGLVWRIVHAAMESDEKLLRVCVLIVVIVALGGAAWLVIGIARLPTSPPNDGV